MRQHDEATGETVTYAYDKAGRRILMAGAGRETAYRYGRNGELLEVSDNRQRLSVSYKYDVMGRETERIFGNGVSQHTAYDKAGRIVLITEKSGNNILLRGEGYVYDSLGRRSATVSHTGAVTRYEYNPAGQLAKVQYPESQELRDLQEQEARQHGLFWQESVSGLSNGHLSSGEYTELSRLLVLMRNGSGFLPTTQVFRTESYTYDANGNRATKTTAYGTITYSYDAENRLVKTCGNTGVGVEYAYDNNGNLLSQTSSLKHSIYEYNPQNRMVRSRVVDDEARTIASTRYGYDPLGRRALVQDNNATTLRTLYDGLGFDVVKESPVYASGGFVDTYNTGIQYSPAGYATGERYRYLDDGVSATSEKYQYIEDNEYQTVSSRYAGERSMLYAHGSPVAINRAGGSRGYLGTDIMGSTRSVTDSHGVQEGYYDYDVFGNPVTGDFTTGVDYGYLGKSYDSRTGLYNYGYRDYNPQTVRFTTVDPIRDGTNWFAYVNNDPVNYVDLWGLEPGEIFSTIEEAAIDFGITYNDDSIKNDREYGASVYKVTGGYTYTIPSRGTSDSVIMSVSPSDPSIAFLHTHAAYNPEYDNENFSSTDKKTAIKKGIDIYVATPGGTLKVFNPEANTTTLVSTDMPTENTPYNESKSIGFLQTIWNHAVNFFTGNSRLKEEVKNESKKNK